MRKPALATYHADGCEPDPLCVWELADLLHQYMSERKALHLAEIIDRAYRGSER